MERSGVDPRRPHARVRRPAAPSALRAMLFAAADEGERKRERMCQAARHLILLSSGTGDRSSPWRPILRFAKIAAKRLALRSLSSTRCRGSPSQDVSHGRRPPLLSTVGCWDAISVELGRDLGEALPGGTRKSDPLDHLSRNGWPSARPWRWLKSLRRSMAAFRNDAFEFVDRDELRTPPHLDGLEIRHQAAEGRAADAKRLGSLCAGVGEALDPHRLANDRAGLHVAAFLLGPALLSAPGHQAVVQEC